MISGYRNETILGMYVTDSPIISSAQQEGRSFWINQRETHLLPVLDLIQLNCLNEIRFTNGVNSNQDVVSYNRNTSSQRLSSEAVRSKKLDITTNDLLAEPITLCLNFTNYNITVTGKSGIPKMYRPIDSKRFEDFTGRILFVSVHTFNTPNSVRDVYGYSNYIESLIQRFQNVKSSPNKHNVLEMLNYVLGCLSQTKDVTLQLLSDTVKVCSVIALPTEELLVGGNHRDFYLKNRDLLVSLNDPVISDYHPSINPPVELDKSILDSIRNNGVSCFIVDNNDQIADRYINIAGKVIRIPKIKDKSKPDGLYMGSMDNEKSLTIENLKSLEELDNNSFVYKSVEEALNGSDMKARYAEEYERKKAALAIESEETIRKIREESTLRINELEETARASKLAHEQQLRDMELTLERAKTVGAAEKHKHETFSLERKSAYESDKYSRDSLVETIKTVGAVAGLGLGLFALYTKFSK